MTRRAGSRLMAFGAGLVFSLLGAAAGQGGVESGSGAQSGLLSGQEIFVGLLAGRDMSAAAAAHARAHKERGAESAWAHDPDRFRADPLGASHQALLDRASRQAERLSRMASPWQNSSSVESLLEALHRLQAHQMLAERRARTALDRVRDLDHAGDVARRAQDAADRLSVSSASVAAHLATVQGLVDRPVGSLQQEREWRDQLASVVGGLKQLADLNVENPAPVLRALPFDRPLISPGALPDGPPITPSYEQETPPPGGSQDLAASPGAPLSDVILAKALELGHDYVAIYEFVRGRIRTEYYSGAMKGAEATLRSGAGNDVDQASLLIALYRASNVPARYVHGVARLDIQQVGGSLGLTDPQQILTALSRAGIPHRPVIQGGQVGAVDMASTWVSIYVPYANYRGIPVDLAGRLWLPLAPAVKHHGFEPGSNIAAASGLDGEALVESYLANEILDPPLVAARNQVEAYLADNGLGSLEDQLPRITVAAEAQKLLPAALPFEAVSVTEESNRLGADRQQILRLIVRDPAGAEIMDESVPVSELLDQRVTFSYAPATVADFNAIREFGGRTGVPAYLVRLRPQLKVNGKPIVSAQGDLGMGDGHSLTLELSAPAGSRTARANLIAGAYAAINLSAQLGLPEPVADEDVLADDTEGRAARLLYNQAARHAAQWDEAEDELAGMHDLAVVRPLPAVSLVSTAVAVSQIQGLNQSLTFEAANLDAALRSVEPVSRAGDSAAESQWMRLAALQGSFLEATIFESQWAVESISADKGLRLAVAQALPVAEVDAGNAAGVIPGLSHDAHVIDAVQNAVDQGYRVLIPETEITFNAWTGSVWHSWDPELGSSGYFISGELAGGSTTEPPAEWILDDLANVLNNPYGGEPNTDPNAAARIRIVPASDGQFGKAGESLDKPLTVLVTDADGRPVQGATVRFEVAQGDAGLGGGASPGPNFVTTTDSAGIAQAPVQMGTSTSISSLYVLLEPGDEFSSQISENWVSASVPLPGGFTLGIERPFFFYTVPNEPAQLVGITSPPFAYPRAWAGPAQARLEDQYGNPVSNREIRYTARPAIPPDPAACGDVPVSPARLFIDECPIPSVPAFDCGFAEVAVTSNVFGPFVQVVTGEGGLQGTVWPVVVSSPGVPSIDFAVLTLESLTRNEPTAVTIVTIGTFDNILDSALVGEIAPAPRRALTFIANGGLCTTPSYGLANAGVEYAVVDLDEDGAFIINTVGVAPGIPVGPNEYEAYLPVGPEPIRHASNLLLTVATPNGTETRSSRTFGIAAVEAEILSVQPVPVPLNLNGESTTRIRVNYLVQPADFGASLQINLLEDGNVVDFKFLARGPNAGMVDFAPGKSLDIEKDYSVQLLVNSRTPFEIATDPFPVELTEPIVKSVVNAGGGGGGPVIGDKVRTPLSFVNDIDIPNERLCRTADVALELTQEASVSMVFERLDAGEDPTGQFVEVLSNQTLPAGTTRVDVSADELGTDLYRWEITAVSALDGRTDTVEGRARSSFVQRNSLPVGHPFVEGIDLATGKMILSREDINVPGKGANLQFLRSYSSGARNEPSVMGAGWSHGYMSRVVHTPCDDFVVSAADGGSIRFVRDGTGFRPLKGYHGSLVQNAEDGSFDYYPRNGTRYHFARRQDRTWWLESIEDTNGNQTQLVYEDKPGGPVVKSVTDPSGRQLTFEYENRLFRAWSGDVVTSVQGPAGIALTFEYDEFGNLISARREGGLAFETYQYMTGGLIANANLLVDARDEVVNASRSFTYSEVTLTTPLGSFTLDLLSAVVDAVSVTDSGQTTFSYTPGAWGMNQQTVVSGPLATTTYTMNAYGATTSIAAPNGTRRYVWETDTDVLLLSETDENGTVTAFTYDEDGNILTQQTGSHTRSYTYANLGPFIKDRAESFTNYRGLVTTNSYDGSGNLTSESLGGVTVNLTYDGSGNLISRTDGNGNTKTYAYDASGNLLRVTDALGNVTSYRWDQRGRKTQETDANGNRTRFEYDNRDRITSVRFADGGGTEVSYSGRVRTETDERGGLTVYTHDGAGRIVSVRNALGDTRSFTYDGAGNKLTETDFAGRSTSYSYDSAGRNTLISEPEGRTVSMTYDGVGNVLSQTISGSGGTRTTTFAYDDLYRQTRITLGGRVNLVSTYDGEGNQTSDTDPEGRVTTFSYDAFNRRLSRTGPLGSGTTWQYDDAGNLVSETNHNSTGDQTTRFVYDASDRQIQSIDAEGGVRTTEYDAFGNIVREVDARGNATTHQYDARNRRTQTRDPGGATTSFAYDLSGNLVRRTLANGNVESYEYDALNRRTSESDSLGPVASAGYDSVGNLVAQTDGRGSTIDRVFDDLNRLVSESAPLGRTQSFTYNVFGDRLTETDPAGATVTHTYNDLGQRTATTGPLGLSRSFTYDLVGNVLTEADSRGNQTQNTYNELNQLFAREDPLYTQSFEYDTLGNVIRTTDQRGIVSTTSFDRMNRPLEQTRDGVRIETRAYDAQGNLLFVTDANGNQVGYEYDSRNLVIRENRPLLAITRITRNGMGDIVTEERPSGRTITRTYDLRRRLVSEANGAGETTRFEYDANDNQTARVRPIGRWTSQYDLADRRTLIADPLGNTTAFAYDSRDNLVSVTDANGRATGYAYDARNRNIRKDYPDGTTIEYEYDENGNLIRQIQPSGNEIATGYDALDRAVSIDYVSGGDSVTVTLSYDESDNLVGLTEGSSDGSGGSVTRSYDSFNRLTLHRDRFGQTLQFSYDANGNRVELLDYLGQITRYGYDALNRLSTAAIPGLGTASYHYLANGLLQRLDYPNGAAAEYQYDLADRIVEVANRQGGEVLATYGYDYDVNGNRIVQEETNGRGLEVTTYTYDAANRLTGIAYPESAVIYGLDPVGNRLTEDITITATGAVENRSYSYNLRDQMTSVANSAGTLDIVYQYDPNGNQIRKTENGVATDYSYGARNRLIEVSPQAQTPIQFEYDHFGSRVAKEAGGARTQFVYDQDSLLGITNSLGNSVARFHFGSDRLIAESRGSQNVYYLNDALGSPVAQTDQAGALLGRSSYDAWGSVTFEEGAVSETFGFTGYQKDSETGLYYAGHRYYDSFSGRFLREDPALGDVNNPPSLHRYLYALANPTVYVDPDGRQACIGHPLVNCPLDQYVPPNRPVPQVVSPNVVPRIPEMVEVAMDDIHRRDHRSAPPDNHIFTEVYRFVPEVDVNDTSAVLYYIAFRLDTGEPDWFLPPNALDRFIRFEEAMAGNSALSRVLGGTSSYNVRTQRFIVEAFNRGLLNRQDRSILGEFGSSWVEAIQDPAFYVDVFTNMAGGAAARPVSQTRLANATTRPAVRQPALPPPPRRELLPGPEDQKLLPAPEPRLLLPRRSSVPEPDVPEFGIVVVDETVFRMITQNRRIGRAGSESPVFFADPSDLVGLSDELVVQSLGNPVLARTAVSEGRTLYAIQFPTANQPVFNVLEFGPNGNFLRGGRAALAGPDGPNSFVIIQGREFNVPAQFELPEGTIGGPLVNGTIADPVVITK